MGSNYTNETISQRLDFTEWNKEKWKDFGEACFYVLLSFAFFRILQYIVRWYLFGKCYFRTFSYFVYRRRAGSERNPAADSTTLSAIPPNKKWRICNEIVSLLHAAVSGLWAGYSILVYQDIIKDMINYRHPVIVNLIFVSTGYLLHDLLDLLINERSVRIIELLFHHVVVLTAFATTQVTGMFLGIVIFGLLMELNSVFLHSRSLLNLYGYDKKSTPFKMIALLNMVTLLFFRLGVSIYLMYWLLTDCIFRAWYFILPCFFVIVSLFCTNTVLAYRVMAADGWFGKNRARQPSRSVATENTAVEEEDDEDKSSSDDERDDVPNGVSVTRPDGQQLVANGHAPAHA
ncbi:hypothetical protein PRIPAC_85657 [Pristionchus pacificus]|uniref:TLC domain-containing protein n=1 Tax=Pristionchus pacificus TaxID=54126 RepID=A0A2A6CEJ2_PRIPA|nr:hypothetical protein PRIPAC_85657 [Pristionchus pacificus]|eukprot:PDM76520.1 hypothetical protein PRIPAC_42886 [Pristionchus pacificus]